MKVQRRDCKYSGSNHKRQCPAFGKECNKCHKKIILQNFANLRQLQTLRKLSLEERRQYRRKQRSNLCGQRTQTVYG